MPGGAFERTLTRRGTALDVIEVEARREAVIFRHFTGAVEVLSDEPGSGGARAHFVSDPERFVPPASADRRE